MLLQIIQTGHIIHSVNPNSSSTYWDTQCGYDWFSSLSLLCSALWKLIKIPASAFQSLTEWFNESSTATEILWFFFFCFTCCIRINHNTALTLCLTLCYWLNQYTYLFNLFNRFVYTFLYLKVGWGSVSGRKPEKKKKVEGENNAKEEFWMLLLKVVLLPWFIPQSILHFLCLQKW